MRDLPNLDLMRSVAVMLVLASHLMLYTHHSVVHGYSFWFIGILGVLIFFVHTTIVLMWSLERDPNATRFYVRRAFRIYPLWLVVLGLSIAVQMPTSPFYAPAFAFFHAGWGEILENITLTFNLMGPGDRIIGAAWTLPVEVQMYVVLPFLFFFMRANRSLWPLLVLDALIMACERRASPPLSQDLFACAPAFLPGAMAYLLFATKRPRIPAWIFPAWLLGLLAAFNTFASRSQDSFRSGWLFTLILGLSLPFFRQIGMRPLRQAAHWIARYSYGIYLCHFPAIAVAVHYLQGYNIFFRTVAFVTVLVGLSTAFYHTVEEPMIRLGSRIAKRLTHSRSGGVTEQTLDLEPAP